MPLRPSETAPSIDGDFRPAVKRQYVVSGADDGGVAGGIAEPFDCGVNLGRKMPRHDYLSMRHQ